MDQITFNAIVYARDVYSRKNGIIIEIDDQKCMLVDDEENNVLYISFRGSDNLKNWGRDFTFIPVNRSYAGYVHKGFADSLEVLLPTIKPYVNNIFKQRKLVISGHSLGGAIAQLCGAYFLNRNPLVATIGSPKVYNRFSSVKKPIHTRIAHVKDPVPMPLFMYKHFQSVYIELDENNGKFDIGDLELINPMDHSSKQYVKLLSKMYPELQMPTL